ncbi:MAG: radical SAM protein, partial [Eubacterium sp.]
MNLTTSSGTRVFSHIYIEKAIQNHPVTKRILGHLKADQFIIIEDYAHVFNRHNQDFNAQKRAQKLILAQKQHDFYYEGSPYCENFGSRRFYYTGMIMNCLYDCSYCYLKSIYTSGHMVIFVNNEDFVAAVERDLLQNNAPVYLAISYDSDLFAMDKITGFLGAWLSLARAYPQLTIEVKTKIGSFRLCENIPSNVIFAWSLLPQPVITHYETHTPSLKSRLNAVNQALDAGACVRLSIEPLMPVLDAEVVYT